MKQSTVYFFALVLVTGLLSRPSEQAPMACKDPEIVECTTGFCLSCPLGSESLPEFGRLICDVYSVRCPEEYLTNGPETEQATQSNEFPHVQVNVQTDEQNSVQSGQQTEVQTGVPTGVHRGGFPDEQPSAFTDKNKDVQTDEKADVHTNAQTDAQTVNCQGSQDEQTKGQAHNYVIHRLLSVLYEGLSKLWYLVKRKC